MVEKNGGRAALVTAIGTVVVTLVVGVGLSAVYRSRTASDTPASAAWFPSNGMRWVEISDQSGERIAVASKMSATGIEAASALPLQSSDAVRALVAEAPSGVLWAESTGGANRQGFGFGSVNMYVASDDGVAQVVGYAGIPFNLAYSKPARVLTADPQVGDRLTDEGTASYGLLEIASWSSSSEVTAVDGDCVTIDATFDLTPTEMGVGFGAAEENQTYSQTICRGEWVTEESSDTGAAQQITAAEARAALQDFPPAEAHEGVPTSEPELVLLDREFGSSGAADLLALPDQKMVVESDLSGRMVRALVATDTFPTPLWGVIGSAPTVAAPALAGDLVVTADTAGRVLGIDAGYGVVRWGVETGRLAMQVSASADGSLVAVLDKSGAASLLRTSDGKQVAKAPPLGLPLGVAVLDDVLVVADPAGVRGYRGTKRVFSVDAELTAGPVVIGDQVVVATADPDLVAFDVDGDEVHRTELPAPATRMIRNGDGVALLDGAEVAIFDGALDELARHADDAHGLTSDGDAVTTTAVTGRVVRYDEALEPQAELDVELRAELPAALEGQRSPQTTLRAAAVSAGGVTWVPAVNGVTRFGGGA